MASADFLVGLARALRETVRPLEQALRSPTAFGALLRAHGWHVEGEDEQAAVELLAATAGLDARLLAVEHGLDELLGANDVGAEEAVALLKAAAELVAGLRDADLRSLPAAAPAPLDRPEFWSAFPADLANSLVATYFEYTRPALFAALHLAGIIDRRHVPSDGSPGRIAYTTTELRWDRLAAGLTDPARLARDVYGWGVDLNHDKLTDHVQRAAYAFGLPAARRLAQHPLVESLYAPDNPVLATVREVRAPFYIDHRLDGTRVELGLAVLPIPPQNLPGGEPVGLLIGPYAEGDFGHTIPLGGLFELELRGGFEANTAVAIELRPGSVRTRLAAATATDLDAGATLVGAPFQPWVAVGDPDGTRFEVHDIALGIELRETVTDPDLRLRIGAKVGVSVDFSQSDGFLRSLVGTEAHTFTTSAAVIWSSKHGLSLEGSGSLAIDVPIHRSIGGVQILTLSLAVEATHQVTTLFAAVTGTGRIGPLLLAVQGVGAQLRLQSTADGAFAGLDPAFEFKPPHGIGLAIDAASVTGGGILTVRKDAGLYAGAVELSLQLSAEESLTVAAFGLITTGGEGYSLLVFITVADFRPIPLGFGFTLHAIGGMLALHRTFSEEALREGIKNDTLATLLFPTDPISNAPAIIDSLATAFPVRRGSYLLGVTAKIAWFTPPLVTMDLAVVFEFGRQRRLLILGRISALLPTADDDLVRLILNAVGVFDFDRGTASADAVLVDSRLAHKFPLTGSAAFRAQWAGPGAGFIVSVGGFNPQFAPPTNVPTLERLTVALCSGDNPRVTCAAYLAVTTNTVQFGARADVYAAAYGFSVEADVSFDVLIQLVPIHFLADLHASAQLKRGSRTLFKVTLNGELEGPLPLRVSGKASFEILWCSVTVGFDKTLKTGERPPLPAPFDVLGALLKELSSENSWTARRSAHRPLGVALTSRAPDGVVVIDPSGTLVVKQQVVPLNTDIEVFGGAPIAGDTHRFAVTATLDGQAQDARPVHESFVPSQFFAMTDDERLTCPSFQEMDAGIEFGSDAVEFNTSDAVAAPLTFETIIIDDKAQQPATPNPPPPVVYELPPDRLRQQCRVGSVATAPVRSAGLARFRNDTLPVAATVHEPRWTIITDDGAPVVNAPTTTWSHAHIDRLDRGGIGLHVVPTHEVVGGP